VVDFGGKVMGKINRLDFLNALGAGFSFSKTKEELSRAGVSQDSISTVMRHFRFFQETFEEFYQRARSVDACEVMHPVEEGIDENATLQEAINRFGQGHALSILVKRGEEIIGVLRLSDLFQEISAQVLSRARDET
jgi:CBS domain-containing protein